MTEQEKLDRKYLRQAIKEAYKGMNKNEGGPFGCVIVKDNKVLAKAHNTVTSKNDPTNHAEVNAIRKACKKLNSFQLSNCTIYCSCEPCPMCLGAIYWSRPSRVVFSSSKEDARQIEFDDSYIYEEIEKAISQRQIETVYIPTKAADDLFETWKNKMDKIEY